MPSSNSCERDTEKEHRVPLWKARCWAPFTSGFPFPLSLGEKLIDSNTLNSPSVKRTGGMYPSHGAAVLNMGFPAPASELCLS